MTATLRPLGPPPSPGSVSCLLRLGSCALSCRSFRRWCSRRSALSCASFARCSGVRTLRISSTIIARAFHPHHPALPTLDDCAGGEVDLGERRPREHEGTPLSALRPAGPIGPRRSRPAWTERRRRHRTRRRAALTAIRPFSPFRGSFRDHARGELEPRGLELPPAVERHMEEAQISYNWTRTRSASCAPGP